jgi:hypothetical protein
MRLLLLFVASLFAITSTAQTFEHQWFLYQNQSNITNPTGKTAITRAAPDNGVVYVTLDESVFDDGLGVFGTIMITKVSAINDGEWVLALNSEVKVENVEVSNDGRIFIAGSYYDDINFSSGETLPYVPQGFQLSNMFLICLESNGELAWAKNLSADLDGMNDYINTGLAIGNNGQVHYAYTTYDNAYFVTLDTNGDEVSSFEALGIQVIGGLKCDSENNLYVSGGLFQGEVVFPSFAGSAPFDYNAFVAKINADGSGGWIRFYEDITNQFVSLALNSNEQPVIAYTLFVNITVEDIEVTVPNFGEEFGLIQLDQNGSAIWATSLNDDVSFGGFSTILRNTIRTDINGNVWLAGQVRGNLEFNGGLTIDAGDNNNYEGAIVRFDNQGVATTAAFLTGGGYDKIWSFDLTPTLEIYYATYCTEAYNPVPFEMPETEGNYRLLGKLILQDVSGINENNVSTTLEIYPNPANDNVYITSNSMIAHAEIFDLQGRKLLDKTFTPARQQTLSIKELPAGVYVVKTNGSVLRLVKN